MNILKIIFKRNLRKRKWLQDQKEDLSLAIDNIVTAKAQFISGRMEII